MADVSLKDIYKSFGKTEVIHGITCDIHDGEFGADCGRCHGDSSFNEVRSLQ